jgi:hypothetical protein
MTPKTSNGPRLDRSGLCNPDVGYLNTAGSPSTSSMLWEEDHRFYQFVNKQLINGDRMRLSRRLAYLHPCLTRERSSPYNDPSEAPTAEVTRDWTYETGAGPRTRLSCSSREDSRDLPTQRVAEVSLTASQNLNSCAYILTAKMRKHRKTKDEGATVHGSGALHGSDILELYKF